MALPNFLQQYGASSVIVPAIGLCGAFAVRRKPWAASLWVPVTAACVYQTLTIGTLLLRFGQVRGPDAIGAGIAYTVFVPGAIVGVAAVVACWFARPAAFRSLPVLTGIAVIGVAFIPLKQHGTINCTIAFVDERHRPFGHASAGVAIHEAGLTAGHAGGLTDSEGRLSFQLGSGQSAELTFRPMSADGLSGFAPAWWTVRIRPDPTTQSAELWHLWQNSIAGTSIDQATVERVAATANLTSTVIVPMRSSLSTLALEQQVHRALVQGADPAMACRNVAAIASLEFLRTHGAFEGLKQVAGILASLESARGKLERALNQQSDVARPTAAVQADLDAFARWTGTQVQPPAEVLTAAQRKIDGHIREILDFALGSPRNEPAGASVVRELYGCRDFIGTTLLAELAARPPTSSTALQVWGDALRFSTKLGHRREFVQPLLDAEDPSTVLLACEAMGNQLESEGGQYALDRLERAHARMNDKDLAARAWMHISDLRFRLELARKRAAAGK